MFEIKVESPSKSEMAVIFPEDLINDKKLEKKLYKFEKSCIIISNGQTKQINCPSYTHRPVVATDILLSVADRKLRGVRFNDGHPTKNLFKVVRKNLPILKEDEKRERELTKLLLSSLVNLKVNDKVPDEIKSGYELVIDLYACGGIK